MLIENTNDFDKDSILKPHEIFIICMSIMSRQIITKIEKNFDRIFINELD